MTPHFQVRRARIEDLTQLQELELAVVRDGRGVVMSVADAADPARLAKLRADLDDATENRDLYLAVAIMGDAIAGHARVRRLRPTYTRHVGAFSLEVHPAYQRRGIGRALVQASVEWARAGGIERLELSVRSDNDRARALYASEGFALEATRSRFICLSGGTYVDDNIYVRFLA